MYVLFMNKFLLYFYNTDSIISAAYVLNLLHLDWLSGDVSVSNNCGIGNIAIKQEIARLLLMKL